MKARIAFIILGIVLIIGGFSILLTESNIPNLYFGLGIVIIVIGFFSIAVGIKG
jgi:hypothetical protein